MPNLPPSYHDPALPHGSYSRRLYVAMLIDWMLQLCKRCLLPILVPLNLQCSEHSDPDALTTFTSP